MKHIFYHLAAVMVVVVWGMTFISTKVLIVHGLSPQEIFLFRFLLAYAAVCPISFHRFFARNLKDELYLVGGGVLGGSLFFFLQNMALGLTQASNVSFIICTTPLLTAALTVLSVRTEKLSRGFIHGSIVILPQSRQKRNVFSSLKYQTNIAGISKIRFSSFASFPRTFSR